ncbi:nickel pincer cofactor biosynthesis protein LarB [Halomarina salina]|uniref:Nickel pincer cofactor biosynthesis protein LarB n=1 Tax=Halomarina salina TaxID=1872699 RepID=A0ABD5RNI6_9EURY|nr:nickel pincer cofactor biosynthesis protein LarB [Halomarina salina]
MRDILDSVAAGDLSPSEAEARLRGYATTGAGRFDAGRESRTGVPEAILVDGKTASEVVDLAVTAVETTGRAFCTRVDRTTAETVTDHLDDDWPETTVDYDDRAQTLVAHTPAFDVPALDADVGVVTAGTADAAAAGEAATTVSEMGARVTRVSDVGVAGLHRLLDALDGLREMDVLVVAAGREGALPTVLAGLVDVPIIGLPVASGYGHGGEGEAALLGMLQSCAPITVVNVGAGYAAGVQAGLVARSVDSARSGPEA